MMSKSTDVKTIVEASNLSSKLLYYMFLSFFSNLIIIGSYIQEAHMSIFV